MKLYFTRHGKTEWNLARRFQGMTGDSPLLPASYEEIRLFGQHVKDVPFEKIYASTSLRAQKTAQGIQAELSAPVDIVYDDRLRELGLGSLEGQLIDDQRVLHHENLDNLRYHADRYDPAPFGGESIMDAIQRISQVVTTAVEQHEGPLLFVGHGASLTSAIQWLSGKPLSEVRSMGGLLNSSLSILEPGDSDLPYDLTLWNDVDFLTNGKQNRG